MNPKHVNKKQHTAQNAMMLWFVGVSWERIQEVCNIYTDDPPWVYFPREAGVGMTYPWVTTPDKNKDRLNEIMMLFKECNLIDTDIKPQKRLSSTADKILYIMGERGVSEFQKSDIPDIGVSNDTIKRTLNELIKFGIIERVGRGRSTKYIFS